MAHWLRWLFGTAAAALLLVLWLAYGLAPRERTGWRNPYRRAVSQLWQQQGEAQALLARKVRVDSLQRRLPDSPALTVELLPNLRADVAAGLRSAVVAELADVAPRARVGVFTIPADYGVHLAASGQPVHTASVEYYAASGSPPFCMVVGRDGNAAVDTTTPFDARLRLSNGPDGGVIVLEDVLGPCLFWAKYGAPGAQIFDWLERGGHAYASSNVVVNPLPDSIRASRYHWSSAWTLVPCRTGYTEACRQVLLRPLPADRFPYVRGSTRVPAGILLADTRHNNEASSNDYTVGAMLAAAEREFGREQFARFWQSDADVEAAFAAAFGLPFTAWAMDWIRGIYGEQPRGPRMGVHHVLLVAAFVGLCFALALAFARRRQVSR